MNKLLRVVSLIALSLIAAPAFSTGVVKTATGHSQSIASNLVKCTNPRECSVGFN